MALYNTTAKTLEGDVVFTGTLTYVPRKGEQIKINHHLFIVNLVTYVIHDGVTNMAQVELLLVQLI